MERRILVTGATGFIGRVLCDTLAQSGYDVRAAVRTKCEFPHETNAVGDITTANWAEALEGADAVIHLAGLAHTVVKDPNAYTAINTQAVVILADAASRAGVRRFVYVSSIKAADESDPYGTSKRNAERLLTQTGLEVVIVRPPLVYGPNVRANFLRLMRWVDRGVPLPLGAVRNHRSLVSVWNLCDLLLTALTHPNAPGTWEVSDGEDLSTPDLIQRLARAMKRPSRLISIPTTALRALGAITGKSAEIDRLCGSLRANNKPVCETLGWSAPLTVNEGLARTVEWYLTGKQKADSLT